MRGIVVQVGQTVPLDLALQVATVSETVTVTGASPVIDTTSATTSVNLGEQLLQQTPGGRDIWALVEAKVPSLVMSGPTLAERRAAYRAPSAHAARRARRTHRS